MIHHRGAEDTEFFAKGTVEIRHSMDTFFSPRLCGRKRKIGLAVQFQGSLAYYLPQR
jgi:hypothetical protein